MLTQVCVMSFPNYLYWASIVLRSIENIDAYNSYKILNYKIIYLLLAEDLKLEFKSQFKYMILI